MKKIPKFVKLFALSVHNKTKNHFTTMAIHAVSYSEAKKEAEKIIDNFQDNFHRKVYFNALTETGVTYRVTQRWRALLGLKPKLERVR